MGHRQKVYREKPDRLLSGAKRKLLRSQGDRLRAARTGQSKKERPGKSPGPNNSFLAVLLLLTFAGAPRDIGRKIYAI